MITENEIAAAVRALAAGALVVFPTETLYGIGCDALSESALERLCAAKQRPQEKGLAVIAADVAMAESLSASVSAAARRLMEAFWPGPLTLLLPARSGLPDPIVRAGRIGVRVSGHAVARRLARELGRPIASPSANPADVEPAEDVGTAQAMFGASVAAYLDDGAIRGAPSTLVDPGPPLRILRAGAVARAAIERTLDEG